MILLSLPPRCQCAAFLLLLDTQPAIGEPRKGLASLVALVLSGSLRSLAAAAVNGTSVVLSVSTRRWRLLSFVVFFETQS